MTIWNWKVWAIDHSAAPNRGGCIGGMYSVPPIQPEKAASNRKGIKTMARALSITQPYPALIVKDVKHYETRSWRTAYRGRIYIHASKTRNKTYLSNTELISMAGHLDFGCIIAYADLTDCIEITEDFIKALDHDELISGFYTPGRYAWKLENITPISPIPAKGRLGLWEYSETED